MNLSLNGLWADLSIVRWMIVAASMGLAVKISLSLVGQRWSATYHHTMSYILLPVTSLAITRVISGNIALSLGMIGALSIVRFRTPVRNPFELVVFFILVTIGVALSAEASAGVALGLFVIGSIFAVSIFEKVARRLGHRPFSVSFAEGEQHHTLLVEATGRIQVLDQQAGIIQWTEDRPSGRVSYVASFRSRKDLEAVSEELRSQESAVLSIEARFGPAVS